MHASSLQRQSTRARFANGSCSWKRSISGLDGLIDKMAEVPGINDLEIRRLKKRKLKVKDTIILLQLQLEPDARLNP